jgi:hypothetical protein
MLNAREYKIAYLEAISIITWNSETAIYFTSIK